MARPEDVEPWMGPLPAAAGCDCHICRPDASYDDMDRRTIDAVLEHGWQVILVASDVDCSHPEHQEHSTDDHGGHGPAFAYTLGLGHRVGHPELLMSGLDHRVMHHALNELARRIMKGRRLAPGDALEDVLAGVPVAVEQVADDALRETVAWSGWFHRRKPEALAIVWPDKEGVFAWQPGAPEALDQLQPRAWRVPIDHSGGLAQDPVWDFPVRRTTRRSPAPTSSTTARRSSGPRANRTRHAVRTGASIAAPRATGPTTCASFTSLTWSARHPASGRSAT